MQDTPKTVLLIGAGGGMGRASVELLTKNGYRVIGLDREDVTVPECDRLFSADVTDPASIEAAFQALSADGIRLYAIVYMAGIYDTDSLIEIDEARMKRIFEINVFGAYRTIRTFFPLLEKHGRVVLVTSELAPLDPLPFTGLYGITKGTLEQYAFSLAMELQLLDVKVSVIRPGAVETPLLGRSVERIKSFTEHTSLYPDQAERFLYVTSRVESKSVPPGAVAQKLVRVLSKRRPRFLYTLNSSLLLKLYGILPKQCKLLAIRTYLKHK